MGMKKNKRSMRRQINKYMMLNTGVSNLLLIIIVILIVVAAVNSFGMAVSNIIASDIVGELENPMSLKKFGETEISDIDVGDPSFQRWLNAIGNRFYFNFSSGFIIHKQEEMMKVDLTEIGASDSLLKNDFQFVFVEIYIGNKKVFSTLDDEYAKQLEGKQGLLSGFYHASEATFRNLDGIEAGHVRVAFNPLIIISISLAMILILLIATFLSSLVSLLMSKIMAKSLTYPLNELQRKLHNVSEGDIESALRTEVEVKKPLREIEHLANSTNLIIEKMREYAETLEDHKVELTAQNEELEEKGAHLISVNEQLEFMNVQMKDILDNVGQGFLRFTSNLEIHSGYSQECRDILNPVISGRTFSSMVYPDDEDQAAFVDELLVNILEGNEDNAHLYMPLLPDEYLKDDKIIQIEYKLSKQRQREKSMIVILTDITEKRKLEAMMDKEQHILKMVVKALVNRSMFVEIADSFEAFLTEGKECNWHFTEDMHENKQYTLRQIHTFKGNFSQFDVVEISAALHDAESEIIKHMDDENGTEICFDVAKLEAAYKHDLEIITTYVGEDYMVREDYFLIEKNRILDIERKMQTVLSEQDCRVLLPEIRSLCHKPVKDLFKMYPEYSLKLAERLDKTIYSFEIEAEEILVDEVRFQPFVKSLVHVFRNAVDHGIESPDERVEAGKDMMGSIQCHVSRSKDSLIVSITDDGRGIDIEAVKEKAQQMGYNMPEADINELMLIFDDRFSTTEHATDLSGRGIGLSAVKREVDALLGHIDVKTAPNKGTQFIFTVPMQADEDPIGIFPQKLMAYIAETSVEYIEKHVESDPVSIQTELVKSNRIELKQLTALVNLKGIVNALVMVSVNQKLGDKLATTFLIESERHENIEQYVEDVLAEVTNTVLGNTLGRLDNSSDFLHIGIPAIITNQGAYVKNTNSEMMTFNLTYKEYEWSVHMIQSENTLVEEDSLWLE